MVLPVQPLIVPIRLARFLPMPVLHSPSQPAYNPMGTANRSLKWPTQVVRLLPLPRLPVGTHFLIAFGIVLMKPWLPCSFALDRLPMRPVRRCFDPFRLCSFLHANLVNRPGRMSYLSIA